MRESCLLVCTSEGVKLFADSPYQRRPSSPRSPARGCGWAPGLPACSPYVSTPPRCATAPRGRPVSGLAPAPGTRSCGRRASRADPGPRPASSWRRWRPSRSAAGSGTVTPWRSHTGGRMMAEVSGRKRD